MRWHIVIAAAQEQIGFDALLLCDDADLKELGLRKGARVKILSVMRDWAASDEQVWMS